MEDFDFVNEHVKDSINDYLVDTSNDIISDFGLKFFQSICKDCVRRDCVIRHSLYDADRIASCNYFTTVTTEALESTLVPGTTAVGGTIFYIDDTAYGVYEFYDVHGNVIENVKVGDRPYAYKVISPGSKDKYYVYHDELYNNLTWTYAGDCEYDAYVAADTAACMYSGKTNTDRVMIRSKKTCLIAIPNKSPTIWYQLQQMNDARVGGCNDWFIPSIFELEKLMLAVQSGNVTGGVVAGSSYVDSVFATKYIWSSTEASSYHGDYSVWMWDAGYQCVYISPKNREFAMLIARAF